ncbi:agmatine deiminase [Flexivirga endophytica]|uniref:Agmatine deiminase n=2 Tax=Flexivirga endophytica TaxID=1849103 RepID=A0A916SVW3_9MICO|nr:agmatine deiminase [Flexivirga endophytica]GHB36095.1 agmatine deiminase [Flexivirga endophytica]
MAFPSQGYTLGDTAAEADEARSTWAAVAHAALEFEPVTMVVDPTEIDIARRYLSADIEIMQTPLDDAWMRDIGPTFVYDDGALAGVDWTFNGWGAQDWATWDHDAKVASYVLEQAGVPRIKSSIVNEGGGFHVDGEGTVLLTETVQLDAGRNPEASKADIEAEVARTIGATHAVWLPRGLTRDSQRFGTRGHVDIVAAIPAPGVLLLHDQRNPDHPDHAVMQQIEAALARTTDAAGRAWDIRKLPAPAVLEDDEGPVDYSYLNHLVVNDGVIACSFGDAHDAEAVSVLAEAYPGRRVVTVDARPLFARGGGIHCITQQQPVAPA